MYQPPYPYAPAPAPVRRWWQHPALIITALVVLPPVGIALAWASRWQQPQKIVATVLSGVWFLIPLLSDSPEEPAADAKAGAAAAASASPSAASPSPTPPPATTAPPAPVADPLMPDVVGKPFEQAEKTVEDLITGELQALSAYRDVELPAAHGPWLVCFQSFRPGIALGAQGAATTVHLVAPGTGCPATTDTNLRRPPTTAPAPDPAPDPTPEDDGGSTGSTGGGGSVSYRNCAAVRAAGAAPIRRGDPGYGRHLDRDGDGVGCER
ncbi:excalibur calcium-binding domain-containing protein [Streptomyces sp. NPDC059193]|uniref:excalibur calcium-binding domain-containing protein n=1 Tax=Streptomyces sp. NPDC059193 TaxID=3346763 RepID=UPI0036C4B3A4